MQEASKKCQAKLEEYWMNDGESWFTKEITRGTMTQVRQLDTTKFENQLGLADKLNGIEWQGRIITQSAAYRSFPSQYDPSKWGVWLSPGYNLIECGFMRSKGGLELTRHCVGNFCSDFVPKNAIPYTRPTRAEIPPG
jgi:hypothetical protein